MKVKAALPTHLPERSLKPEKVDAAKGAEDFLSRFGSACENADVQAVLDCFRDDGFWRDMLPLTWTYRSLGGLDAGKDRMKPVLEKCLAKAKFRNFKVDSSVPPSVEQPMPDLSFVQFFFTFENEAGLCSGIARIRPHPNQCKTWQAWTVFTLLEELHGVKEAIGDARADTKAGSGAKTWAEERQEKLEYKDRHPEVLVVGAGQSGLCVAARLGVLGVDTLCIDRHKRVGDNWRTRYASLVSTQSLLCSSRN